MSQDDKPKPAEWRDLYELPELFVECPNCFAVVDFHSQAKHAAWHEAQRQAVQDAYQRGFEACADMDDGDERR